MWKSVQGGWLFSISFLSYCRKYRERNKNLKAYPEWKLIAVPLKVTLTYRQCNLSSLLVNLTQDANCTCNRFVCDLSFSFDSSEMYPFYDLLVKVHLIPSVLNTFLAGHS